MLNRFYDALRVQEAEQRYLAHKAYPRLQMIKIGILHIDVIRGTLNILGTKGKCDSLGFKPERLPLFIPDVTYTIPEIILVAMLNKNVRQWPIGTRVAKVHTLSQFLFPQYKLANASLHLLKAELDIVITSNKRDVSSWQRDEALERLKERAMGSNHFFQFYQSGSGICRAIWLVGLHHQKIKAVPIDDQFNICSRAK